MNQSQRLHVNPQSARASVAGHFGEIAQGRVGPEGPVAVVTLPCPDLVTEVAYAPAPGALTAAGAETAKALAAGRAALTALGGQAAGWGGRLTIRRPVAPGLGAGSSTAETLGAVRAVATAFGTGFPAEREAALCLAAEGAVDPLMHGPCLFATREGRVLNPLAPLPRMLAVGGFAGPPRATDPQDSAFPDQAALFAEIAAACDTRDAARLGQAATRSAAANQTLRPNPAWTAVQPAAERLGALGIAVAHTGSAIALLLPAGTDPAPARRALAACGVSDVLDWRVGSG